MSDTDASMCTRILILDSLSTGQSGKRQATIARLRTYLQHEAADKLHVEAFAESCVGANVRVPQQDNVVDCGCFLLQFVDEFLRGPPEVTLDAMIASLSSPKGFNQWFPPLRAQERRNVMKRRVEETAATAAAQRALQQPEEPVEDRSSDIEEIHSIS